MSRRWCVAETSKDGKINPISPAFEYMVDAVERKNALLETEKYQGKNLQVIEARNSVGPRKPPRRRRR